MPETARALEPLDLDQARDLRRSVLCGELHLSREAVDDGMDSEGVVLLVREGFKPVATARLLKRGSEWTVDLLAVLPSQRRHGLGRALLRDLAELARDQGAPLIKAVAPLPAQAFFQACDFRPLATDSALTLYQKDL